ncbi:MAG: ferritin family protein [Fidelibacterota bacterium]
MSDKRAITFNSIEDILNYAINEEQDAYKYYTEAARQIADEDMKKFLLHLAKMEVDHYNTLKKKLEEYKANQFSVDGILSSFDHEIK